MFVQTDSSPSLPPPFTHFTHCHRSSSSPSSLLISICWVELEYFHDLENQTAFAKMWHSWALGKGWVEGRAAATKGLVGQSQARLRSRLTTFQSQIQRRIKDHAAAAATVIIFLVNIIINSQRYLFIAIWLEQTVCGATITTHHSPIQDSLNHSFTFYIYIPLLWEIIWAMSIEKISLSDLIRRERDGSKPFKSGMRVWLITSPQLAAAPSNLDSIFQVCFTDLCW